MDATNGGILMALATAHIAHSQTPYIVTKTYHRYRNLMIGPTGFRTSYLN